MKEPSLEQPQESFPPHKEVVSNNDLEFVLASFKGMPAEEFIRRFIKAEETERNDPYAGNKKLYLMEKRICIKELQDMKQEGVADMLIKRLGEV